MPAFVKKVLVVAGGLSTAAGIILGIASQPGWSVEVGDYRFNVWLTLGLISLFAGLALYARDLRNQRDQARKALDAATVALEAGRTEATGAGVDIETEGPIVVSHVAATGFATGFRSRGGSSTELTKSGFKGPDALPEPSPEEKKREEEEAARRREEEAKVAPFKYGPTLGPQWVRDHAGPDPETDELEGDEPLSNPDSTPPDEEGKGTPLDA
jgi:hypothetical protein